MRHWLIASLFVGGALGCSSSSSSTPTASGVQIVGLEDGTVEVTAQGRQIFALAGTGPVARTFREETSGVGVIEFERSDEVAYPLSVESVTNENNRVTVEYVGEDRTATLTAVVLDEEVSEFRLAFEGEADSVAVGVRCDEVGTFHGFGEQYNATNQRGEVFELYVNEQGNGRAGGGEVNEGNEHTTYFPMPYYIDARGFGALFVTNRRVNVDLCASDTGIAWFEVVTGGEIRWRVFHGPTSLDVIRQLGDLVGRPGAPPPWAYQLWLGSQGGRDVVLAEVDELEAAGVPASALWVQDWTGIRPNIEGGFGVQYLWEPKETCSGPEDVCYPEFGNMVAGLHDRGYKFLTYVNPFIVDPASIGIEDPERFEPRFNAMAEGGLLVRDDEGDTYIARTDANIPQQNGHPDFSREETVDFIRESLARIVTTYDVDGWMADFGEYLPFDSVHFDGSSADERRNTFPVDWHRVVREALEQVRPDGDWASIARSGFTGVQAHAQIHWVGDQQTDWGELDGLPTVTPALINLGLAGQPFVSLDIAGFSVGAGPSTKELYFRWTELGAFAPVMRTHQGADKLNNWNWNSDQETIDHVRKFAFVHCALSDDFQALAEEATTTGAPILRHMMLVFPDDTETWDLSDQFMIGDSLLVAPVVAEGATTKSVYFPEGSWYDVWTGESLEGGARIEVPAPLGSPPVYSFGEDRTDIREWNMLSFNDCR
jgi:alpha-glucosidase